MAKTKTKAKWWYIVFRESDGDKDLKKVRCVTYEEAYSAAQQHCTHKRLWICAVYDAKTAKDFGWKGLLATAAKIDPLTEHYIHKANTLPFQRKLRKGHKDGPICGAKTGVTSHSVRGITCPKCLAKLKLPEPNLTIEIPSSVKNEFSEVIVNLMDSRKLSKKLREVLQEAVLPLYVRKVSSSGGK